MKVLELENVRKFYKVVRKLSNKGETHMLGLRNLMKFFLWETSNILGTLTMISITVLDNVSFSIEPGQVVGLFGKNSSGKTTMFSILGGIFTEDDGVVRCFGYDYSNDLYEVRKYIIPIFGWLNAVK